MKEEKDIDFRKYIKGEITLEKLFMLRAKEKNEKTKTRRKIM
mgnify:CR=1 FL=1